MPIYVHFFSAGDFGPKVVRLT